MPRSSPRTDTLRLRILSLYDLQRRARSSARGFCICGGAAHVRPAPDRRRGSRPARRSCAARQLMIATAESCTGGLIAGLLTEIPGSSDVVERGFVTYSNEAKMELLGVPAATLARAAPSAARRRSPWRRARWRHSRADIAVAVTGVAGPGGGSAEKPVGLVHLAARRRGAATCHSRMPRYGDIGAARRAARDACEVALDMLREIADASRPRALRPDAVAAAARVRHRRRARAPRTPRRTAERLVEHRADQHAAASAISTRSRCRNRPRSRRRRGVKAQRFSRWLNGPSRYSTITLTALGMQASRGS